MDDGEDMTGGCGLCEEEEEEEEVRCGVLTVSEGGVRVPALARTKRSRTGATRPSVGVVWKREDIN